jgi:hypothetical protein
MRTCIHPVNVVRHSTLAALLVLTGCEPTRSPFAPSPTPMRQDPPSLQVHSTLGDAARREWIKGLSEELRQEERIAGAGGTGMTERARWLQGRLESTASSITRGAATAASGSFEAVDEDEGLIEFGTQIRLPQGGPGAVVAYTTTSRATRITHTIRLSENVGGRAYTYPAVNDDTGFFNNEHLYTSVSLGHTCEIPTTVTARTEHRAGSVTFRRQYAFSDDTRSCGPSAPPCEGGGKGGEIVENRSTRFEERPWSPSCGGESGAGGGGGGAGGEGSMMRCYTVTVDHYWYHPDTGTYEYRYSDTTSWCEAIE